MGNCCSINVLCVYVGECRLWERIFPILLMSMERAGEASMPLFWFVLQPPECQSLYLCIVYILYRGNAVAVAAAISSSLNINTFLSIL